MTVKKLTQEQKEAICTIYKSRAKTIVEMARHLQVSPRTVGRVLVEAGLATPVPRLKGEAYMAVKTLEAWGLDSGSLQDLLEQLEDAKVVKLDFISGDAKVVGMELPAPTREQIIHECSIMEDGTWATLLADIIHLREARKHNSSVSNAMLQMQNKADKHG